MPYIELTTPEELAQHPSAHPIPWSVWENYPFSKKATLTELEALQPTALIDDYWPLAENDNPLRTFICFVFGNPHSTVDFFISGAQSLSLPPFQILYAALVSGNITLLNHFSQPEQWSKQIATTQADQTWHQHLVLKLLSQPEGIRILFNMIKNGFTLFYPDMDFQLVHDAITKAGANISTGNASDDPTVIPMLLDELTDCFTTNNKLINDAQKQLFFHSGFLQVFINKHILDNNLANTKILEIMQEKLFKQYFLQHYNEVDLYYQLAKACGFSFSDESLSVLVELQADFEVNYHLKLYQYILDKLIEENLYKSLYIAARVLRTWLYKNFKLSKDEITLEFNREVKLTLAQNPDLIDSADQMLQMSKQEFIKGAGLMLSQLKRYHHLDVLVELSLEITPLYRIANNPYQTGLLLRPGIPLHNPLHLPPQHGLYAQTLLEIQTLLATPDAMDSFLRLLNNRLTKKLPHLLPIPDCWKENPIQYYETNYPNENAFNEWKSLPLEHRKLNSAMHHVLLDLENEDGYNLPANPAEDSVPRFYRFVPADKVKHLITIQRRIFKECAAHFPALTHGVESHRIQMAMLRFFINRNKIKIPPHTTAHDVLTYIINNELWTHLFDHFGANMGSPFYLMTYLRHTDTYPALQQFAWFTLFKNMDKQITLRNNPDLTYSHLLIMQCCFDRYFMTDLDDLPGIDAKWADCRVETDESDSPNNQWLIYYKKRPLPSSSSSSSSQLSIPSHQNGFFPPLKNTVERLVACSGRADWIIDYRRAYIDLSFKQAMTMQKKLTEAGFTGITCKRVEKWGDVMRLFCLLDQPAEEAAVLKPGAS